MTDPLAAFKEGAFTPDRRPVPLTDTRFCVEILGGVAVVETVRTFRNAEDISIEAVITFPVPTHAALFRLEAAVDGRRLTAKARARAKAREVYEEAVDAGRAAVLHEEVLKGVHTLSVAHIAPGAEIEITTTWATSLTSVGSDGHLRIPLTVGDIYGRSGLNDVDELISGAPASMGRLSITSSSGSLAVAGVELSNGEATVPLNAPIDITVQNWEPSTISGVAADGRSVRLTAKPHEHAQSDLYVAILVDHSGSMATAVDGVRGTTMSQHQAVLSALSDYRARARDHFDLWQFDDTAERVGETNLVAETPATLADLASRLAEPGGGTDIGRAVDVVLLASGAPDILLITDGKSFQLDPHRLAGRGRRISVLLVGEDSLDAKVGHLAALSGGDIWVAAGADIGPFLKSALDALRSPATTSDLSTGESRKISRARSGINITAVWDGAGEAVATEHAHPAAGPFAASLALSLLNEHDAADLAEAEGLVTHLTSLVLIDEAATIQEGIPALRKVALETPRVAPSFAYVPNSAPFSASLDIVESIQAMRVSTGRSASGWNVRSEARDSDERYISGAPIWDDDALEMSESFPQPPSARLLRISEAIDWDQRATKLLLGNLSELERWVEFELARFERDPSFVLLAERVAMQPRLLLIAVVASLAEGSRNAERVWRKLATNSQIDEALNLLTAL